MLDFLLSSFCEISKISGVSLCNAEVSIWDSLFSTLSMPCSMKLMVVTLEKDINYKVIKFVAYTLFYNELGDVQGSD